MRRPAPVRGDAESNDKLWELIGAFTRAVHARFQLASKCRGG